MLVMVVTYGEPKKGLPKFYFKQPLGNTTYGSPNLATLAALKHCRYLRYIYMFIRHSYTQMVNNVTLVSAFLIWSKRFNNQGGGLYITFGTV